MPYIKSSNDRRKRLQEGDVAQNAGELNYQIFYYVKHHLDSWGLFSTEPEDLQMIKKFVKQFLGESPNYQRYNDMTGALVRCEREIWRRLPVDARFLLTEILDSYDDEIAKYEDLKIIENGDVE